MDEQSLKKNASSMKSAYGATSIEYVEALDKLAFYYRQNEDFESAHQVLLDVRVCRCLEPVYKYILESRAKITHAGQVWSKNCRIWIYFDSLIDCDSLRQKFNLNETITTHVFCDNWQGSEKGFVCSVHHDALMGIHPNIFNGMKHLTIK